MNNTNPKEDFYKKLETSGFPAFLTEHRFHPERLWRFDLAWIEGKVALEIEGGTWTGGRHSRGAGLKNDCYKYNAAQAAGWIVIRATTDMLRDDEFLVDLFDALKFRGLINAETKITEG